MRKKKINKQIKFLQQEIKETMDDVKNHIDTPGGIIKAAESLSYYLGKIDQLELLKKCT